MHAKRGFNYLIRYFLRLLGNWIMQRSVLSL